VNVAKYHIDVTTQAALDLAYYRPFEQKEIIAEIRLQLSHEPLTETANRKTLRVNMLSATRELRVGRFRVFYDVANDEAEVRVFAIGHKVHNQLFIRGREVQI
jgi:mRNA-degrading endonuclease RelE of RelBE toxin-antitoxin system